MSDHFYVVQFSCLVSSDTEAVAVTAALAALDLPASLVTQSTTVVDAAALRDVFQPVSGVS